MSSRGFLFISYSTANKDAAEAIYELFQQEGISCWMAPYDIPVGKRYAGVITGAIRNCAGVLLLLSDEAQNSVWVMKEVERAINYHKTIITACLQEVVLNDEFELFISTDQMTALPAVDKEAPEMKRILAGVKELCRNSAVELERAGITEEAAEGDSAIPNTHGRQRVTPDNAGKELCFAEAAFCLGRCYEKGIDVEADLKEAVKWYQAAADSGYPAVRWITEAARQNHASALDYLGSYAYHGIGGITQSFEDAVRYYEQSAELEHAAGQYNPGLCYYSGKGVEQDRRRVCQLFEKAALQDHKDAMKMLEFCYGNGIGTEKDQKKADYWKKMIG